jgi:hypothetical protein
MEKEQKTRRIIWLIIGIIITLVILWRILTPIIKVADPNL